MSLSNFGFTIKSVPEMKDIATVPKKNATGDACSLPSSNDPIPDEGELKRKRVARNRKSFSKKSRFR